ncbi:MAG: ATP-binding protein [Luteibaculaceae bacterium]
METLIQRFELLLQSTSTHFKRYLHDKIKWESRMIGVIGARGVGKTTLLLQYIKENLDKQKSLYISADDLYFSAHGLYQTAADFYRYGGENLCIDEIHKYKNWSAELKNIYDALPGLKIVFTGSSVLDIVKGSSDLSRRAVIYTLEGLSFREYLNFHHNFNLSSYTLEEIINQKVRFPEGQRPLSFFKDYVSKGYYPFSLGPEFDLRLNQVILQTLETDIPQYANLNVGTSVKLKKLLTVIAESVPFKPNFTKIAALISVSRNTLEDYLYYMERAGLIAQLRTDTKGIRGLGKVEKVFLNNTNLIYNLVGDKAEVGNLRETFFYSQVRVKNSVSASKVVDFEIGDKVFEIGGKNKTHSQTKKTNKAFVVKDDIEFGYQNVIPLWSFGFGY